jgi:hypothetical protein
MNVHSALVTTAFTSAGACTIMLSVREEGNHSQQVPKLGALSMTLYLGSSRMIPMADPAVVTKEYLC